MPSTSIVPEISKTSYNYSEVIWDQPLSSSLIVYVVFSRVHYTDGSKAGVFKPTNMVSSVVHLLLYVFVCISPYRRSFIQFPWQK